MKKSFTLLLISLSTTLLINAQSSGLPQLDKSPMDMSYYPANFPVLKVQDKVSDALVARVIYSRPKRDGRTVFGDLVEYGKVWRLGANEATEIEFFKQVKINGKKISKGRYTLYAIVNENTWTIIINKETDTWGQFKYDSKKDVVRVSVPVQKTSEMTESLAMNFQKSTSGFGLIIGWENIKVTLPIAL